MRVAVVGATGAVGREMLRHLESPAFPVDDPVLYCSTRSRGTAIPFGDRTLAAVALDASTIGEFDLVLASAGAGVTREWAPRFADRGAVVVDNSSAFRSDPACPLVVPEINAHTLTPDASIIANPNCSTIQMVVALAPLHAAWGLTGVRVATYQSVSGAGARAIEELTAATRAALAGEPPPADVFPRGIAFNALPDIGSFDACGESGEERKMREETRRILEIEDLAVSAVCVRVPVYRGHSEAVWASFERPVDAAEARALLTRAGVIVLDDPGSRVYPTAAEASGHPDVFVGRIRRDPGDPKTLLLWVVADNLLKGAATNAYQIAVTLAERGWLPRRPA